jgi:hypothetical protein
MTRLVSLLLAFLLFGWMLPSWAWAICPILLGVLLVLAGLAAMVGSSHGPSPTNGLGGVLGAFLGVCVILLGVGMTGYRCHNEAALRWFASVPDENVIAGGVVTGLLLAVLGSPRRGG